MDNAIQTIITSSSDLGVFPKLIIILVVGYLVLYFYMNIWLQNRTIVFEDIEDARITKETNGRYLRFNNHKNGYGASLSFWLYISDWDHNFNKEKNIFQKDNLKMYFSGENNDLVLETKVYNSSKTERVIYRDVPIQKWLHITVIVDNRTLDLWVNDKLYSSKILTNIPKIDDNQQLIVNSNGGFGGYISRFYTYDHILSKKYIQFMASGSPINRSIIGYFIKFWDWIRGFRGNFSVNVSVENS
jgi:hypothetical protein